MWLREKGGANGEQFWAGSIDQMKFTVVTNP